MAKLGVHCFSMSLDGFGDGIPSGYASEPLMAGDGVAHAVIRRTWSAQR